MTFVKCELYKKTKKLGGKFFIISDTNLDKEYKLQISTNQNFKIKINKSTNESLEYDFSIVSYIYNKEDFIVNKFKIQYKTIEFILCIFIDELVNSKKLTYHQN